MTELFTALVDVSRKTNKEARLCFKGFGTLFLFKNRELAFNQVDDMVDLATLDKTNTALFVERQREREDLSFIDQASAVLSRGGGMTMSVKSSALRSLSSAMTAPTNPSVRSSVIQSSRKSGISSASRQLAPLKQDLQWIRYKKKNEQQAREREMRKSQSMHHGSPLDLRSLSQHSDVDDRL